jgi:oxygen-independent coproporphyrinogen-3 oxidase
MTQNTSRSAETTPELVKRYAAPVPRYTSYPTAPHFNPGVGRDDYAAWLAALPAGARLSLYLHVPFCERLCWYCGCNTKATQRYEPVVRYLKPLRAEIGNVASRVPARHTVTHVHWGGGSPSILSPGDIRALAAVLQDCFSFGDNAEFAVEVDPRNLDDARIEAFARGGINRVSIGVQDFDPRVQAAINREQSFETTRRAVEGFRAHGVRGINIDLVYGLPHQTRDGVEETIGRVLELQPDRIALFGYAHLPERIRHQSQIDNAALPDAVERFAQSSRVARQLNAAGYVRIGLDHFAKPTDPLATAPVNRNFQGYTTDGADTLIGLGASSIGRFAEGYVQNAVSTGEYERLIAEYGLAVVRGFRLSLEDRVRASVIERLMCDFRFSARDLQERFGEAAAPVLEDVDQLLASDRAELVERTPDGFEVTERGKPFVRSIAACFDTYLGRGAARHATGV